MPRSRQPLQCRHCGKEFPRRACAGLFCGTDCQKAHYAQMEQVREQLKAAGFSQHAETHNLWHKDGVHVSEEQVKHAGIEKTLRLHASHAAGIQIAQQSQA